MKIPKLRVSQSLLNDYRNYQNKELCGLLFDALWVDRQDVRTPPTQPMMIGNRFEYEALGKLDRASDVLPTPLR